MRIMSMFMTVHRIFTDKIKLREMLSLRELGWSLKSLGLLYGVDHSAIYQHCKHYSVKSIDGIFEVSRIIVTPLLKIEPIKKIPSSYIEYLKRDRNRQLQQKYKRLGI